MRQVARDGTVVEIGSAKDIPKQIEVLLGDISALRERVTVLAFATGQPDLMAEGVVEERPPAYGGNVVDLLDAVRRLESRVESLAQRLEALEGREGD
jgi:ubiquinone biosynthesis protein UbiJ